MELRTYTSSLDRGASRVIEVAWYLAGLALSSSVPGSWWRVRLLRGFGARIGVGVVLKPRLRVKFPWRLSVGDWSWIGEGCWIDNLDHVVIGSNCCISQGCYLCTGSHDLSSRTFALRMAPIVIEDHTWICAMSVIAPGARITEGSVCSLGSVISGSTREWTIAKQSSSTVELERRIIR